MSAPHLTLVRPTKPDVDFIFEAMRQLELDKEMAPARNHAYERAEARRFAAVPEPITGFGGLTP
jgi:hypothetical protein